MPNLIILLTAWSTVLAAAAAQAPARSPGPARGSADCSTLMYEMVDCTLFLEEGGPQKKPTSACCSGLKTVLDADPECVCYALRNSGRLGLHVNMTRAEGLPSACRVSAPPISRCHVSVPPSGSPVSVSPSGSPVSASPREPPANSPVNVPSSTYPTLAPLVPASVPTLAPTTTTEKAPAPSPTTATREAPAAAPASTGPGSSPSPSSAPQVAGSRAYVSLPSFLIVVGYLLLSSV